MPGTSAWNTYRHVFSTGVVGGNRLIYAINPGGTLGVHLDDNEVVTRLNSGSTGWDRFKHVFAGGSSAIYALDEKGALFRFNDNSKDGNIDLGSGILVGQDGWSAFSLVFSSGSGDLYGLLPPSLASGGAGTAAARQAVMA